MTAQPKFITHLFSLLKSIISAPFRWLGRQIQKIVAFFADDPEDAPLGDTLSKTFENPSSLLEHLDALRKHILRALIVFMLATLVAITFNEYILAFLTQPIGGLEDVIAIDVTEPISTVMKTSLLTGFAIALPYIVLEIYLFIAPGLKPRARLWGLLAIPAVLVLFISGMAFAYYIMLPTAVPFLIQIGGINAQIRVSSIVGFVTRVLFWLGLSFEFPLIIFILASLGIVSSKTLLQNWRIAVVVIAIIAAVVTPTIDPVNMMIVMAPLIVLYFLSIGLAAIAQRRRAQSIP